MAYDIASTIGRGWGVGRGIGDDIAETRYRRGSQEVVQKYTDLAAAEGKTLEDYLPAMEAELQKLGSGMFGADRRGVVGRSGAPISREVAQGIYDTIGRASERRAGAAALAGDQAGARDIRARSQYGMGNFDAGQGQQVAGDTIRATSGALRPDGTYDRAGGAQALAGVGARYGDAGQANEQTQAAQSFRLQEATALADQLFRIVQNPKGNSDRWAAVWENFKQAAPELSYLDTRMDDSGKVTLYTNGEATGDLTPQETAQMLTQFTQAPGQALGQYNAARLKSIEESKARDTKISDDYRAARLDVIKAFKAAGLPDSLATKLTDAQKEVSGGGGGWQLQDIGDEPGTFLMQKNGQVYTIKTNEAPDLAKGKTGGTLQVFDAEGNPVPGNILNKADRQRMESTLVTLAGDIAKVNNRLNREVLRDQLAILNELETQERGTSSVRAPISRGTGGGGGSRADRNNNPGNIEDGPFAKSQPGYKGSDGRFAIFDSPESGTAAQGALLASYGRRGFDTVGKIIGRWSPQSDPTNAAGSTNNYAAYVAEKLGVSPDQQLDLSDPQVVAALQQAMYEFESGNTGGAPAAPPATATASAAPRRSSAPTPVASAAAPQRALPTRAEISPSYVRGAAGDLQQMAAQYEQARDALARFDAEQGTEMGFTSGPTNASVGRQRPVNLSPSQARVRAALEQQVMQLEDGLRAATAELRGNTGALQRQTGIRRQEAQDAELASRYGGAADFFSRARGNQ